MKRMRWTPILAAVAALTGLALPVHAVSTVSAHPVALLQETPPPPAPASTEQPPAATYVGSETCTACHDAVEGPLGATPHGSEAFAKLAPHGCESCHGPGSLHAEDPDNEALRPRVDEMSPAAVNATCQSCHSGRVQFFWPGSMHDKRGLSCITCHSIHQPRSDDGQLQKATAAEQCATCHQQVRAETWKNSHHPIREGRISCTDCHNPHGGPAEKMVRADTINDLCYTCHTEKRGPFLWEHAPVRESCMNCHTPHGSNHPKLQKVSVPYLCQQCHANTRHPGTLYDARNVPVAPDGLPVPSNPSNRLVERGCVNCHSAVHGSNHPSSPYLAH